ncbi:MAG TPA: response regulator [Myxococcota bacterium]|nr:response regulator [Myxococcota bacterium]
MERKKKVIIIVDDEPDVTLFLQTALEDNGYTALTAANAAEGLSLIRRERPALVCLDILMPEESGISLFQKIKSDPEIRDVAVIFDSGLSLARDFERLDYRHLPDGTTLPEPDGFIEKPIEAERFLALVEKVLAR